MDSASKFLLLVAFLMVPFITTEALRLKTQTTRIQFYMHDVVGGPNPTAVPVAGRANSTGPFDFGTVYIIDNALTVTPDPNSAVVGRAQGMYTMASQNELSLLMTMTITFTSGPHNGSSFSVLGRNPVMSEVREMPIVGGAGDFRLARGYCLARSASMNQVVAVVGYNVTLVHF